MTLPFRRKARPETALVLHDLSRDAPLPERAFVLRVPGAEVPLLPLDLPPGLKGVARERVARRQVRDAIGAGPEMRPARLGPAPEGWRRMLVVETKARGAWAARVAGTACRAVLPDYLCLPAAAGLWVIETEGEGEGVRARLGPEDGFAAEPDLALALLEEAGKAAPPRAVLRLGPALAALDAWLAGQGWPVAATPEALAPDLAPARFAHGELTLDLARDPEAERAAMRRGLGHIAAALALALTGFGLWTASVQIETERLAAQGLAYRLNAERLARAGLIPSGPILDIRAQVGLALERAAARATQITAEPRPLEALRLAGAVLAGHELRVTRAGYQPGAGLVIDLEIGDFAALDALMAALAAAGTEARVTQSVAREGAGVEAVLALAATVPGAAP
jgi:general secretion pathway protein L